jgi:hypothetical protein
MSLSPEMELLVNEYHTKQMNDRERAALEARIWDQADAAARSMKRHEYLAKLLNVSNYYEVIVRGMLYYAGEVAEPLWERVLKKEMTYGGAAKMLREARRVSKIYNLKLSETLTGMIAKYESLPATKFADGRITRKNYGKKGRKKMASEAPEAAPATTPILPTPVPIVQAPAPAPKPMPPKRQPLAYLIEQHKSESSERKRAAIEAIVWERAPKDSRKNRREVYLAGVLGDKADAIRSRADLYNSGEAASAALWDRVEGDDMPLNTAVRLMRDAKRLAAKNKKLGLPGAVAEILTKYDSIGNVVRRVDGKKVRVRGSTRLPDLEREKLKLKLGLGKDKTPENFWARLRQEIASHMATRLTDVEPAVAQELWGKLELDLKALVAEFQHRIERYKKEGSRTQIVSRRDIIDSCRILGLDPPDRGASVNIKLAAKLKKMLVREYHPDVSSDERNRDRLDDVIKAYHIIETYNKQVKGAVVRTETN